MTKAKSVLTILFFFSTTSISLAQNYFYIQGKISKNTKSEIKQELVFFAEFQNIENATISVMRCALPTGTNATLEFQDNKVSNRKMFLIRINEDLAYTSWQRILAHEMTHVNQYFTQQLVRHSRVSFSWRGKKYVDIQRIRHHKRPWEIEAIEQEKLLLDFYSDFKLKQALSENFVVLES